MTATMSEDRKQSLNWELGSSFESTQGTVRYAVEGHGPAVVLVHGTPWSSFSWYKMIPVLAKNYRVHYYDFIGYGQSEKRSCQRVSLDVQAQLLIQLIEHWGICQPSIVAHDFGGATALRAHLLQGCEFHNLLLIDVVALTPWGSPFFSHIQHYEQAFAGLPAYIHQAVVETYIKGALHQNLATTEIEQLVKPWLGEAGQVGFYRQIAQANEKYTSEMEALYPHIRCPVSILWGENDGWIPLANGRRLHKEIPQSSFTVVPGAGHLAQMEAPDFVNQAIVKCLKQTDVS